MPEVARDARTPSRLNSVPTPAYPTAKPRPHDVATLGVSSQLIEPVLEARGPQKLLRKEVIQPHVPVRLPCYDFTPVIDHTVVGAPLAVRLPASGAINSHGVTGGVYKTRERIQRSIADLRLLAIPPSCSRVADCNLN